MPGGAARPRRRGGRSRALMGRSSCRAHASTSGRPVPHCRAGGQPGEVQQTARPVNSEHTKTSIPRRNATCLYSLAFRMRLTSGRAKRQALSTPSTSEPAMSACWYLSLIIQTIQSFTPARKSDYNNGATLNRAGMCVHVFPSISQFGRADGDAHV